MVVKGLGCVLSISIFSKLRSEFNSSVAFITHQLLTLQLISSLRQTKRRRRKEIDKETFSFQGNVSNRKITFTILKILVREPLPSPLAFLALADCDFWSPWQRKKKIRRQCIKHVFGLIDRGLGRGRPLYREQIHFNSIGGWKSSERKTSREYNKGLFLQGVLGRDGSVCSTKNIKKKLGLIFTAIQFCPSSGWCVSSLWTFSFPCELYRR